jgi:hypothetical protein
MPDSRTLWPLLMAALLACACSRDPADPEAAVRTAIEAAERAAETGRHGELAALLADDYADRDGRDRRAMSLLLRGVLLRYPRLELVVTVRGVELQAAGFARARLDVIAAGAGRRIAADAFPVVLDLRDDGDGWRATAAAWGAAARN